MRNLIVLTKGEYSDYRIVGVFSSAELAEKAARTFAKNEAGDDDDQLGYYLNEYHYEPFVVDGVIPYILRGYRVYHILMLRDGTVERCWEEALTAYYSENKIDLWRRSRAKHLPTSEKPDCLNGVIIAKTEKQAIKILNESRTQRIALGIDQWEEAPDAQP